MDTIFIDSLKVQTVIGVPDEERSAPQQLSVSLWLEVDTKAAAATDDVTKTIDYAAVTEAVHELCTTERKTIERLAQDIADMVLVKFSPNKVTVSIDKFILPDTDRIALTITRP